MNGSPRQPLLMRILRSFEFSIVCVFLLFSAIGFWLVQALLEQAPEPAQVSWQDDINMDNFDYNFPTPREEYEVDLSLWREVPERFRGMKMSVVRQSVTRRVIRRAEQDEYVLSLHTSGLKPEFASLTHSFSFTKDYRNEKPFGAEKLNRFTARLDISHEPVGEPFSVTFVIHSWNAFQGEENQVFGVFAKPHAEHLFMRIKVPPHIDSSRLRIEQYRNALARTVALDGSEIEVERAGIDHFNLQFDQPAAGDGYFVRW